MVRITPRARKLILRVLSVVVVVAVAALFAIALVSGWDRVVEHGIAIEGSWAIAAGLFTLAVCASGVLWGRVLRAVAGDVPIPIVAAVRSHLGGWVVRYISGVGSLFYKTAWAHSRGIGRTIAVVAFAYENIYLQLASIVGGALILLIVAGPALFVGNALVVVAVGVVVIGLLLSLSRPVIRPILEFVATRKLRERASEIPLLPSWRSFLFVVQFLIPRVLNGIGVVLIAVSMFDAPSTQWLAIGAGYAIAAAIGILAVFAPGGLGVREGAFVGVLVAFGLDVVDAVLLAIAARFVATVTDLFVAAIYGALTAVERRQKKRREVAS